MNLSMQSLLMSGGLPERGGAGDKEVRRCTLVGSLYYVIGIRERTPCVVIRVLNEQYLVNRKEA